MAEQSQAEETRSTTPKSRITFKNKRFTFRSIIRDILREDICISGSVVLVEKIEKIAATLSNPSAVRLLLGDGELCIQAFLSPNTHGLVDAGEITMGCYVRLEKFYIQREDVERRDHGVLQAGSKKRKRKQQVVFLKIDQLETIGWDFEYIKYSRPAVRTLTPNAIRKNREILASSETGNVANIKGIPDMSRMVDKRRPSMESLSTEMFDLEPFTDEDLPNVDSLVSLKNKNDEEVSHVEEDRRQEDSRHDPLIQEDPISKNPHSPNPDGLLELLITTSELQNLSTPEPDPPPNLDLNVPRETKLIPIPSANKTSLVPRTLASLSKLPARQNSPCTVFAIIDEISPVKPCPIPPHKTREIRLVDPSTTKRVLLSILWQPEGFDPAVGTPVLLRGLKNHRYDGGSLNAYPKSVSPFTQNEDGSDWWIPFPYGWDGCDVDGYLEWWKQRQENQA